MSGDHTRVLGLPTGTLSGAEPVLRRVRLERFLDEGHPVALVVAPAGTGKTCGTTAWAEQQPAGSVRWCSAADVADTVLDEPLSPATALVVDDAHDLGTADQALLARRLAVRGTRLVMLARREPEWADAALTTHMSVARPDRLRLDDEEAAQLARSLLPGGEPEDVTRIVVAADGWAAAVTLMAGDWCSVRRLTGAPGDDVPARLSARAALLVDAALDSYPSDLGLVLACLSQEAHLTSEAAVVLTGDARAPALLQEVAADAVLLAARRGDDPGRPAWRLHPVVGEVLRRRALSGGAWHRTVADAHERAVAHHLRAGEAAQALRHAVLSERIALHLDTLHETAPELLARSETELVAAALEAVPGELRDASPAVLALDALLLRSTGRPEIAKRLADRAVTPAGRTGTDLPAWAPPDERDLDADLAGLQVWTARCGWSPPARAVRAAAEVLGCPDDPAAPHVHDASGVSSLRVAGLMLDLAALQVGTDDLVGAAHHLQAAAAHAQASSSPVAVASAASLRAVVELAGDGHQTAARSARRALAGLASSRIDGVVARPVASRAHLVLAVGHLQALELDAARDELARAAADPDPYDHLSTAYRHLLEAELAAADGDGDTARRVLEVLPRDSLPRFARRHVAMAHVSVAVALADLDALAEQAAELRAGSQHPEATVVDALGTGLAGDASGAVARLDAVLAPGDVRLPRGVGVMAAAARLGFLLRAQDPAADRRATDLLPDALSRASAQRLWRSFTSVGGISPRLRDLLVDAAAHLDPHPAVATALGAIDRPTVSARGTDGRSPAHPADPTVVAELGLTSRELDVLHALARGGTNRTIARVLFVSENTVKTHLASLYRKLAADGRVQALVAARTRGLL
ncbi:LuxR C-terminal-related transcriptional regulator [Aeromicrobium massiliense]|uniref:LuxR C-terminal-related transcriptional regulator n=1 Tax=Aeromicrobium massiliense TaxID=1464554 RepID=UPI0006760EC9|nr:LuxR C-terminal-related transcriptional regulator [Aeromicrobium massiliense]